MFVFKCEDLKIEIRQNIHTDFVLFCSRDFLLCDVMERKLISKFELKCLKLLLKNYLLKQPTVHFYIQLQEVLSADLFYCFKP